MPATALLFLACGVVIGTGLAALIAFLYPVPAAWVFYGPSCEFDYTILIPP